MSPFSSWASFGEVKVPTEMLSSHGLTTSPRRSKTPIHTPALNNSSLPLNHSSSSSAINSLDWLTISQKPAVPQRTTYSHFVDPFPSWPINPSTEWFDVGQKNIAPQCPITQSLLDEPFWPNDPPAWFNGCKNILPFTSYPPAPPLPPPLPQLICPASPPLNFPAESIDRCKEWVASQSHLRAKGRSKEGEKEQYTSSYPSVKFVEGNKHPCPYEWCSATFTRPNDLARHLNTAAVHRTTNGAGRYICGRCGEPFARPDALKKHEVRKACSKSASQRKKY